MENIRANENWKLTQFAWYFIFAKNSSVASFRPKGFVGMKWFDPFHTITMLNESFSMSLSASSIHSTDPISTVWSWGGVGTTTMKGICKIDLHRNNFTRRILSFKFGFHFQVEHETATYIEPGACENQHRMVKLSRLAQNFNREVFALLAVDLQRRG